ncbi:MAG: hypothetical protein HFI51_01795 [Lachnospiraceae bacterium]|nr:hypothetical protein [Lachnospiraceae bacterium]
MRKKEKERWKNLFAVERDFSYGKHLKETRLLLRNELKTESRRYPLSFWGLMAAQIRFLAWKIWFLQGMVLAFLCCVFFSLYSGLTVQGNEWAAARFLCGSGGVTAVCAVPILQRSLRFGMYELECSTRFSVRGGLAAQLLFIGIGDAGMLTALAYLTVRYGCGVRVVFLFGIIPFLTAAVTGLMLWMRRGAGTSACFPLAVCLLAAPAAYEMIVVMRFFLRDGILWFGIFYALLCAGMIGKMCRKLCLPERGGFLLWKLY